MMGMMKMDEPIDRVRKEFDTWNEKSPGDVLATFPIFNRTDHQFIFASKCDDDEGRYRFFVGTEKSGLMLASEFTYEEYIALINSLTIVIPDEIRIKNG